MIVALTALCETCLIGWIRIGALSVHDKAGEKHGRQELADATTDCDSSVVVGILCAAFLVDGSYDTFAPEVCSRRETEVESLRMSLRASVVRALSISLLMWSREDAFPLLRLVMAELSSSVVKGLLSRSFGVELPAKAVASCRRAFLVS